MITAYVQGREAADYRFTSALPVTLMKILAPTLIANINAPTTRPSDPENRIKANATPRKISFDGPILILPSPVPVSH